MARNTIVKSSVQSLGGNFIPPQYLPEGKDEYYLRKMQDRSGIEYRRLTAYEIEALVKNRNTSDDWNKILVSDAFNPELVKNCKFYGLVRIGKLEPYCLEYSDLKVPVGLYNSTIISCDFGDNVVIDNVNYLAHYIIGNEVIIVNVNELATTNRAKFGNGIVKEGEDESIRIWLEICNENGGRSVIPFSGMLPGDAWLWSKYRDDEELLQKFKAFTEQKFNKQLGYYGKVGDRTVIKNCAIIKDVWIGSDAYIKGANKLKNLTIQSGPEGITQIGEGCELVNGIINHGCRIFYGVKAVRFIMASHSQLKYGARLINSYLGNNATISCCEVLNSLIFPAHEQHHNNSFLCAALVMGQSNIPAGATIGSNHNSRGADGEIIAGRGFWPGLCVSLKHNTKVASFTILAKGSYPYELNIPIPFCLVSNNESKNQLSIMPAYWFMYNMYALARNAWKYGDRDKRDERLQALEYDFLAPDSVNEMFDGLYLLQLFTGKAWYCYQKDNKEHNEKDYVKAGKKLLDEQNSVVNGLEVLAGGFENTKRKTIITKVQQAYNLFITMIRYYGCNHLIQLAEDSNLKTQAALVKALPVKLKRDTWVNVGGQLMPVKEVDAFRKKVRSGKIQSWEEVHSWYEEQGAKYKAQKAAHAFACLEEITGIALANITTTQLKALLEETLATKEWITNAIYASRAKDYANPYRKMAYSNQKEMDEVLGKLDNNSFIRGQREELLAFTQKINQLITTFRLK
ncbi:MAG TPA: DUF4954 family protein [Chitinophagaceae bacterium]|nr:DUF4954 family protein [Chitinophagaceae bacterium]